MSIKFYDVKKDYTDFLRSVDIKIPNISYIGNDKFLCGVVLKVNQFNYYAPISSLTKKLFTSQQIIHTDGRILGTIKFSFMFPCPDNVLIEKDFTIEPDEKYRDLLINELNYCDNNYHDIKKRAEYIYKRYLSGHDPLLIQNCCNFPVLEIKMQEYIKW